MAHDYSDKTGNTMIAGLQSFGVLYGLFAPREGLVGRFLGIFAHSSEQANLKDHLQTRYLIAVQHQSGHVCDCIGNVRSYIPGKGHCPGFFCCEWHNDLLLF
jgi:hypothetical protein